MHVHTCYSPDSDLSLEMLMEACWRKGLDGVAITDHNTIAGALRLRQMAPFLVIVGEEIETTRGEILGLFLEEAIPPGLSPQEAIAAVRAQGGLVGVPHPLDRLRRSAMGKASLLEIIEGIDFLEGFNSRVTFPNDNRRAQELALTWGLPITAGSDAHTAYELGRAYVELADFNYAEEFLEALKEGHVFGHLTPLWIHLITTWAKLRRRLRLKDVVTAS
jgi:hypothetical protein